MSARVHRRLVLAGIALFISACGSAQPSSQSPRGSAASSDVPATRAAINSTAVGETDTDWGRIWDAVPAGFPRYPGATPADDASASPSSARYAVYDVDPGSIAAWLRDGMERARFRTDISGPLEDGSFRLASVGERACRIETTIAPLGGMTIVTVLYGAGCPMP